MAKRQSVLLVLIVCLPLALLVWLGSRLAHNEQTRVRRQFHDVFEQQLQEIDANIIEHFQVRQRELLILTESQSFDPEEIRERMRKEPRVRQIFVLNPNGTVMHPRPGPDLNEYERQFLIQTRQVILDRDLIRLAYRGQENSNEFNDASMNSSTDDQETPAEREAYGWYSLYWGRGLHLIFWNRRSSGHIVGVLLERSRWIADLIGELPETNPAIGKNSLQTDARIRLIDSNTNVVYQWGQFEPLKTSEPFVDLALSQPIRSWRVEYLIADDWLETASPRGAYLNIISGILVSAVTLVILGLVFYREYSREIWEATRRVNFVN